MPVGEHSDHRVAGQVLVFLDSKAVIGVAHRLATGTFWASDDFTGGVNPGGAAFTLRQLGFYVDEGSLFELTHLQVDKTHGKPAPYQYLVLRWAISPALAGTPRLSRFPRSSRGTC